jgi:hypothetical protein
MSVYKIFSLETPKQYVGISFDVKKRWSAHQSSARTGKPGELYEDMRLYTFSIQVLETIPYTAKTKHIKKFLADREKYFIKTLHTKYPKGYNITPGGFCNKRKCKYYADRAQALKDGLHSRACHTLQQMSIPKFTSVDFSAWTLAASKTFAGGKGAFSSILTGRADNKYVGEEFRSKWNIVPKGEGKEPSFTVELEIPDGAFKSKMDDFDTLILQKAFEKKEIFGPKAKYISSTDALKPMFHSVVQAGKPIKNTDGFYPSSFKLRLKGWADEVDKVVYEDKQLNGKLTKMAKDCTWKARSVDESGRGGPSDRDTKLFLYVGKDAVTGNDQYTDKVPVTDPSGTQLQDTKGNPKWRWVGPQDLRPNSMVRPVFSFQYMYLTEAFGVTVQANYLYIKPAPPSVRASVDGLDVLSVVDAEKVASAVLQNMAPLSDVVDSEEDAVAEAPVEAGSAPEPKKKRAREDKKTTKEVVLDEAF